MIHLLTVLLAALHAVGAVPNGTNGGVLPHTSVHSSISSGTNGGVLPKR